MTRVRIAFGLHVALAALTALVLAVALTGAAGTVSLSAPSAGALAAACGRIALPDVGVVSLATLALGSLAVAVVTLSVRCLMRQARDTRRFVAALRVIGEGPGGAAVFAGDAPQAFCAGLLRPRVYISEAALELPAGELTAVLAHEAHHRRLRDPLRVALARAIGEGLFFLPAARRLPERYDAVAELAADRAAVRAAGAPSLASALLAFQRTGPVVVGISPERVGHLLGDAPRWELPLAVLTWSLMILGAGAAVVLRLGAIDSGVMVNLPLVAAQSCMLLMAAVPLVLGATALLGGRGLISPRRS